MTGSEIRQAMISAREEYIGIIKDELLGPGSEFSLPDREHELISSHRFTIRLCNPFEYIQIWSDKEHVSKRGH